MNNVADLLNEVIALLDNHLTNRYKTSIKHFMQQGKYYIVLYKICDYLFDNDFAISTKVYELLEQIVIRLNVSSNIVKQLKPNVVIVTDWSK